MTTDYSDELTDSDLAALHKAAGRLDDWGVERPSVKRYNFYRRRYSPSDALAYALAYLRNANEQYERCLSHDTGAEGWRRI